MHGLLKTRCSRRFRVGSKRRFRDGEKAKGEGCVEEQMDCVTSVSSENSPEETPNPRRDSKKIGRYHAYDCR